jgi:hypothetical protein
MGKVLLEIFACLSWSCIVIISSNAATAYRPVDPATRFLATIFSIVSGISVIIFLLERVFGFPELDLRVMDLYHWLSQTVYADISVKVPLFFQGLIESVHEWLLGLFWWLFAILGIDFHAYEQWHSINDATFSGSIIVYNIAAIILAVLRFRIHSLVRSFGFDDLLTQRFFTDDGERLAEIMYLYSGIIPAIFTLVECHDGPFLWWQEVLLCVIAAPAIGWGMLGCGLVGFAGVVLLYLQPFLLAKDIYVGIFRLLRTRALPDAVTGAQGWNLLRG